MISREKRFKKANSDDITNAYKIFIQPLKKIVTKRDEGTEKNRQREHKIAFMEKLMYQRIGNKRTLTTNSKSFFCATKYNGVHI